ncbi:hypothetical protein EON80_30565, partial [bacterium]
MTKIGESHGGQFKLCFFCDRKSAKRGADCDVENSTSMQKRFIVALTGASGAIYAQRLLLKLADAGHKIDLVASEAGCVSMGAETDIHLNAARLDAERIMPGRTQNVTVHG